MRDVGGIRLTASGIPPRGGGIEALGARDDRDMTTIMLTNERGRRFTASELGFPTQSPGLVGCAGEGL